MYIFAQNAIKKTKKKGQEEKFNFKYQIKTLYINFIL